MTIPGPRRRATPSVLVGSVAIGSAHPVVVQSMTSTDTADVAATVEQAAALAAAGSELVRVTVNTSEAARAVPRVAAALHDRGVTAPLVGDFHYNGHVLLAEHPDCAAALAKYRVNPGNVGAGSRRDANFEAIVRVALRNGKPLRIGVNWGSLDQALLARLMDGNAALAEPLEAGAVLRRALVESALRSAEQAVSAGLPHDRIILSAKVSSAPELVAVTRDLAARCDHPLHLGLTEAGMGMSGLVASSAALAPLLLDGIGDTIRVSLTPAPGGDRADEVRAARQILQSLGLRSFEPRVTACPGCGRTSSTLFQEMARDVERFLRERMPEWRLLYPGVEDLRVAVMGCVVNGPGESRHADVGISLPGAGEDPKAPVYVEGRLSTVLKGPGLVPEFLELLERYVASRYGA
jgi:(E)-4-hydroxy-3-methylbut-2-enyl-diphosphate synthase